MEMTKLSYTKMHQNLEEQCDVGVTVESLRHLLIMNFGDASTANGQVSHGQFTSLSIRN